MKIISIKAMAIIESDDEDDANIFSITNDDCSEGDEIIANKQKEEWTLSAVPTRRT